MQILALGCVSHFLPALPLAHQDHFPPLTPHPIAALWTRAMSMSGVSELWVDRVAESKDRRKVCLTSNLSRYRLWASLFESLLLSSCVPLVPLSISVWLLQSLVELLCLRSWAQPSCHALPIHSHTICMLQKYWPPPNPIVPFKGTPTQERCVMLLRQSVCFIQFWTPGA